MISNFPDGFKTVRIFFQMTANFPDYFKTVRIFQMTANFPDDFKTVQIFQMTADFGCWKQRWPAPSQLSNLQTPLSRRLPSDRCVPSWRWDYQSELNISNNFQADIVAQHQSRIQMRKVGDELANSAWLYCNQSDSIAYSLLVDVFYRPHAHLWIPFIWGQHISDLIPSFNGGAANYYCATLGLRWPRPLQRRPSGQSKRESIDSPVHRVRDEENRQRPLCLW